MKFPSTLANPSEWQAPGADLGRLNVPSRAEDTAPIRTALQAVLTARHRRERETYLRAVEALDVRRGNLIRRVHELTRQAQSDPRQASALPSALEQRQAADIARRRLHEQFVESIHALTGEAELCDAAWRSDNERSRDRRLTLSPTGFVLPAGLLDPVPDPYG